MVKMMMVKFSVTKSRSLKKLYHPSDIDVLESRLLKMVTEMKKL
jgi:hypothetical protein